MVENLSQSVPAEAPAKKLSGRRQWFIAGALVVIIFMTYILAWWDAYHLSSGYIKDADASFEDGRYLDALSGYEQYDNDKGDYVQHGGYIHVQRIWSNDYARPVPDLVQHADARIDEIIYDQLTIEDAELFIQENIGRSPPHPYLGVVYLRLGELYQANGQWRDAMDIYEDVPYSFPDDSALIERAQHDIRRLQWQKLIG